ncbi:MAG TPA: hypothetical protein VIY86_14035 [Pirellulaceae bacterium]
MNSFFPEFVLRLNSGLALACWTVPARIVPSGFFRVQLWVCLGLSTAASLWLATNRDGAGWAFRGALLCATVSYLGSVCWFYEKSSWGRVALLVVAGASVASALSMRVMTSPASISELPDVSALVSSFLDHTTSAMVLGWTTTSMLLGHWYLNAPGMQLGPLQRLIGGVVFAIALRTCYEWMGGAGMIFWSTGSPAFLALGVLRWLAGILGTFVMAILAWRTLRIPNTQSATGILYVAVMFVFVGELASLILSTRSGPGDPLGWASASSGITELWAACELGVR